MRRRNIKNAHEKLNEYSTYLLNLEGDLSYLNNKPLHIEIGMGKGQFIIEMAKRNPNIYYVGIEKYESVLLIACKKLTEILPNLRFICLDASKIDEVFPKGSVEKIYLNFSDPWPKSRHDKRRLTSPIFLNKYEAIATKPFEIEFKTDNRELFAYSIQTLNQTKYTILELTLDLHADKTDIVTTEYEDRFTAVGNPIYYVRVKK